MALQNFLAFVVPKVYPKMILQHFRVDIARSLNWLEFNQGKISYDNGFLTPSPQAKKISFDNGFLTEISFDNGLHTKIRFDNGFLTSSP